MKLKEYLRKENFISNILVALDYSQGIKLAAMTLVEKLIPCILHMNMRAVENFIKMLLQEELSNYLDILDDYIHKVETFMNTRVFGKNMQRVRQWLFPWAIDDKGLIEEFNFKGN